MSTPNHIKNALKTEGLKTRASKALGDKNLQQALSVIGEGFVKKREKAVDACPEFGALSDQAVMIKDHTLLHLEHYLNQFEQQLTKNGGQLHYASTANEAQKIICQIAQTQQVKRIAKGKTMIGEEIDLTHHLEQEGFECVETDLGEYLIQLRNEMPSHIIAPAVHLTRDKIREDFQTAHTTLNKNRKLETPEDFVQEARAILREKFVNAELGITGANLLIADQGSVVIVTNEGNGDLCASLPKTHIVITSFEKLVPTFEDASTILRLLARSATGQAISTYTTIIAGAKRNQDEDGPEQFHVVLLDNGRSQMLGSKFKEMLRCIRCGACLNHCPVYQNLGGHAYGSVYPGPMGSVFSPQFMGNKAADLPFASSFCGRCNEVCPMQIPLTKLMRHWRDEVSLKQSRREQLGIKLWAALAKRPRLYNLALKLSLPLISRAIRYKAIANAIPALRAWGRHRTLPVIATKSFQTLYKSPNHQ